jgi:hypothetical protein
VDRGLIGNLVGLDKVRDLIDLAQWALTMITGGTISDEHPDTIIAGRLDAATATRLRDSLAN